MILELEHLRVRDAMHAGILSCSADAPLGEVALTMSVHKVHAVAITDSEGSRPNGVVSDMDVAAAIASGEEPTAGEMAATEPMTVSSGERLDRAAQLMTEYAVAHLVAVDHAHGRPVGVISTLDLAAAYAAKVGE